MSMYTELTPNQARVQIDLGQVYGAYRQAKESMRSYAGGMTWKSVSERDYLIRITNRHGGSRSLGPRSDKTEVIYAEFVAGKTRCAERLHSLNQVLLEQSAMGRAIGLGRLPVIAGNILRAIEEGGLNGKNLMVIGTHALYAYEAAAGVRFSPELMATQDIDFLWDARSRLQLADPTGELANGGVLSILRSVDKSFEPSKTSPYRAINKDGFFVDLIRSYESPPWRRSQADRIADDDLTPSVIDQVKWLLSSEKFHATVIDQSGRPVEMTCPDPRAFAIYKAWLSDLPERESIKKKRDFLQSQACAELVVERLQHLPFDDDQLRMFPAIILGDARRSLDAPKG